MIKHLFLLFFIFRQISFFIPINNKINFYDYKIENFSQSVSIIKEKKDIRIDIRYLFKKLPYVSKGFLFPKFKGNDKISSIAKRIYYSSDSYTSYVKNVLLFLKNNLKYDESKAPQDPITVLKRGTAFCTGYTNLAYELLKRGGITVKKVSGFYFFNKKNILQKHSWIEVFFPNNGWFAIDPISGEFSDSYIYGEIREKTISLKDFSVSYSIEN